MAKIKEHGIIAGSIDHQKIVWVVVAIIVAFGIYALAKMKKDEFPAFSYPQGIVAGVYPGANSEEVEAQLTKPLEELLFSLPEVDRKNTYSVTKEGICYVYVMLDLTKSNYAQAWTKIRNKINENKALTFPAGVLAIAVIDDFGDTSSLLIAMESDDKTYREMREYTDDLTRRLRDIPQTGNVRVMGEQTEEIAVIVDKEKLSFYGISPNTLMLQYASQGFLTTSGTMETTDFDLPLHIENPVVSEEELEEQIIYSDAAGNTVRLRDVATVERRLLRKGSGKSAFRVQENPSRQRENVPHHRPAQSGRKVGQRVLARLGHFNDCRDCSDAAALPYAYCTHRQFGIAGLHGYEHRIDVSLWH